MRIRLPIGVAAVLMVTLATGASPANAGEPGRLAALTARQELRDQVCIAMAKGQISRGDRYAILSHAKNILKPEEYEGLKRAMDRISPPKAAPTKPPVQTVASRSPWTIWHQFPAKCSPRQSQPSPPPRFCRTGWRRRPMCGRIRVMRRRIAENARRFFGNSCGISIPRGPFCPAGDIWRPHWRGLSTSIRPKPAGFSRLAPAPARSPVGSLAAWADQTSLIWWSQRSLRPQAGGAFPDRAGVSGRR